MKTIRTFIAIMAIALCLSLAISACGDEPATPNPPPRFPTPTLTPSPSPSPTATQVGKTPTPTFTTQLADCVEIYRIKYKGIKLNEPDEYVIIRNRCDQYINLQGWVLKNITGGNASFTFPFHVLEPGLSVRVYTDEYYPQHFRFGSKVEIWNNSVPDTAALYDAKGRLISTKSYDIIE